MLKSLVSHYSHPEEQYLQLIRDIIQDGHLEEGRNGNTFCNIGCGMYFNLENGKIPVLTTKKVAIKTCLKELLWFIKGETNNKILKEQNVHIWDLNGNREFLDSRGLHHYAEDDLGPIYGFQWRHFNANYVDCSTNYENEGIDQLQSVIDNLKNPETRYSRRHVISAWNPSMLDEMALPPCHVLFQFHVTRGNKLSCTMYQRSGDIGLGVPFNIASYSALTHLIAHHCDLEPYEFIYFLGNAHIYENHVSALKEQVLRTPYEFPTIRISNKRDNINGYCIDDFHLENYKFHKPLKMTMIQ